jgi:hypothetical protein
LAWNRAPKRESQKDRSPGYVSTTKARRTRTKHDLHRYELGEDGLITPSEVEELELRLYEPDEHRSLLQEAGFTGVKLPHPFDGAPASESDLEIVVEATRP